MLMIMRFFLIKTVLFCLFFLSSYCQTCTKIEFFKSLKVCNFKELSFSSQNSIYILYDVNNVEGFNLRRDVYIRLATFVKKIRNIKGYEGTKLVLPPFHHLFHWKSNFNQNHIFWNKFFDLKSFKKYTNVLDMWEFFEEIREFMTDSKVVIDEVYKMQHFDNMFENGVFEDKFEEVACSRRNKQSSSYFEYINITENHISCLNFQGSAMLLHKVLETNQHNRQARPRIVLFEQAETILHDFFGDEEYWKVRRSMRFNNNLVSIADAYRKDYLGSTNEKDLIQRPYDWQQEKPYVNAKGGNYLSVHLRRMDFLYGRDETTPSLRSAANQIKRNLLELGLTKVFLASDCTGNEYHDLLKYLRGYSVFKFHLRNQEQLGDGGLAIIDQIICSHARKFIGTFESTFTYRIYEEREILGFPQELTFNTMCKRDDLIDCKRNSVWPIRY